MRRRHRRGQLVNLPGAKAHEHALREQERDPPANQPAYPEVAEEEEEQAGHRIEGEDVAEPDKIEMDQAEDQQPEHAGIMDLRRAFPRGPRLLDHQQSAGAEQEGEQAAHLAVDEDEAEQPGAEIGLAFEPVGGRVHIGLEGHREGDDVHRQYAHHRDAADDVERGDAAQGRGDDRRVGVGRQGSCGEIGHRVPSRMVSKG
jgi:hypothetical protein